MKPQQLDLTDFQDWLKANEMLYAAESTRKKLVVTGIGYIHIYHHGEIVWSGTDPKQAIERYNDI